MNKNQSVIQLLNSISKKINNTKKIKKKEKILISISGGQDSICLFFIFIHFKKQWKWSFGIIYCNHLWQQNSFYSGSLILKLVYLFSIPMYYSISSNQIFNEKNARYWRYDFFYRLSFFYEYKFICIGHTLNDTIETTLFQNIRANNLKNLSLQNIKYFYSNNKFTKNNKIKTTNFYNLCILYKYRRNKFLYQLCLNKKYFFKDYYQNIYFDFKKKNLQQFVNWKKKKFPIDFYIKNKFVENLYVLHTNKQKLFSAQLTLLVRPILSLNRFDLKKLLLFFNLPLYPDTSNQKKIYSRNRIRKDLLPTLKFFFNPQIEKNFFQSEKIKMAEFFQLNLLAKQFMKEFYFYNKKNVKLNTLFFFYLPVFIQRKLINQFLRNILAKQVQFINIQNTINLIKKTRNYTYMIPDYIYFLNNFQKKVQNNVKYFPVFANFAGTTKFFSKKNSKLHVEKQKLQKIKFFAYSAENIYASYKKKFFIEHKIIYQTNLFQFWFLNMFKNYYFINHKNSYKKILKTQKIVEKNIYINSTKIYPFNYVYFLRKKISQNNLYKLKFNNNSFKINDNFKFCILIQNTKFEQKLVFYDLFSNVLFKKNKFKTNLKINYKIFFMLIKYLQKYNFCQLPTKQISKINVTYKQSFLQIWKINQRYLNQFQFFWEFLYYKKKRLEVKKFQNNFIKPKIGSVKSLKNTRNSFIVVNKVDIKIKKNIYIKNINFCGKNRFCFKKYNIRNIF